MADFIIPKGKAFDFTLRVIEKDSFLAQDVKFFDAVNSTLQFRTYAGVCVPTVTSGVVMVQVPDDVTASPLTYLNGVINVSLSAAYTAQFVPQRGEVVDGAHLKPAYEAVMQLIFTDGTPARTVIIDNVYVIPASC